MDRLGHILGIMLGKTVNYFLRAFGAGLGLICALHLAGVL
jgi:hypothetical protein